MALALMGRRFLRADKLLPGDVLLSLGAGPESAAIARYTRGPYSHASIYLNFAVLFEAIADGIGFTGLEIARLCDGGSGFLLDVSHYQLLEVRRHPVLAAACSTIEGQRRVAEHLGRTLVPENGKEYPALTALSYAVPWIPSFIIRVGLKLTANQMGETERIAAGMFCSQLVCEALSDLDAYPLRPSFVGRRLSSRSISPNHLRSRLSLLQIVPDAIVGDSFPCEVPDSDPILERQRQSERERTLVETRLRQSEGLAALDKHNQMKLRIAVHTADQCYENLRRTMNRIAR